MDITQVQNEEFNDCLPQKLHDKRYNTYSIHGAAGNLYDRYRWYKLVGFEHTLFKEDFPTLCNCKSFKGKCDYDLFEPITEILSEEKKVMLYWLTLNTHSPYDDKLFINDFDCESYELAINSEACLNFKQQYQFFSRLSEYIKDGKLNGVDIYIVGDHAPPIMSLKGNSYTYKDLEVSWIHFTVNN